MWLLATVHQVISWEKPHTNDHLKGSVFMILKKSDLP